MTVTPPAAAAWYEVTGTAPVVSSIEDARTNAIKDALYRAVNFAGGDLGNISNIGQLITDDRDQYQFANNEIRYMSVDKIDAHRGNIRVNIRIDIYPEATACHTQQYKKTVLFTHVKVDSPQQAVMGNIYDVGQSFTKVLSRQVALDSRSFVSLGETKYDVNEKSPERVKMIAEDTGAQYIVTGDITDLSSTYLQNGQSDMSISREFAMNMKVFDGKTGARVVDKNYRDEAVWPFARTSQVDTSTARFWESSYGHMLRQVSRDVMLDLENELACKITLPEVVARFGNTITLNLGRIHGVKQGDKLQLWHTGSFIDQRGLPRTKVTRSDVSLTVSRVYEHDAEATINQPDLAASVRIGDVMNKPLDDRYR
ncbi:hypothetical protein VPAL9027_00192 [Vibrio palustris]|uniref:Flagellar basal-body protein n=2 Tax=Vibrio palustris TaxID=1918946 RepID=A0A1R4B038_9VIBR|nr:hypothetical protein VPAL9027_00192 [Vibrio palustris]